MIIDSEYDETRSTPQKRPKLVASLNEINDYDNIVDNQYYNYYDYIVDSQYDKIPLTPSHAIFNLKNDEWQ